MPVGKSRLNNPQTALWSSTTTAHRVSRNGTTLPHGVVCGITCHANAGVVRDSHTGESVQKPSEPSARNNRADDCCAWCSTTVFADGCVVWVCAITGGVFHLSCWCSCGLSDISRSSKAEIDEAVAGMKPYKPKRIRNPPPQYFGSTNEFFSIQKNHFFNRGEAMLPSDDGQEKLWYHLGIGGITTIVFRDGNCTRQGKFVP
jgi:hypothetical protein